MTAYNRIQDIPEITDDPTLAADPFGIDALSKLFALADIQNEDAPYRFECRTDGSGRFQELLLKQTGFNSWVPLPEEMREPGIFIETDIVVGISICVVTAIDETSVTYRDIVYKWVADEYFAKGRDPELKIIETRKVSPNVELALVETTRTVINATVHELCPRCRDRAHPNTVDTP